MTKHETLPTAIASSPQPQIISAGTPTTSTASPRRIALYGRPGAGKSTFSGLLKEQLIAAGMTSVIIKLAAPLYEIQAIVYAMAGKPLLTGGQQDGLLLNDLGGHLRRINPEALTSHFILKVRQAEREDPRAFLICDDLRAADVEAVIALGFTLVEVSAPDTLRRERKHARNDLSAGNESHPTEAPVKADPHRRVNNVGSLSDLRAVAAQLVAEAAR